MRGYLCVSGGMGAREGPVWRLGGWGWGRVPLRNLQYRYPISYTYITAMSQGSTEYIMYTVSVQWEDKRITHTAWTKVSAMQWLYAYPRKDVFAKVTDLFGRRIAVRYYR